MAQMLTRRQVALRHWSTTREQQQDGAGQHPKDPQTFPGRKQRQLCAALRLRERVKSALQQRGGRLQPLWIGLQPALHTHGRPIAVL